ncbi:cornifelin homolog A isoform X2 [Hydra vulgaris]|uniref:cornifelin homolog A isoform X2 n=1 Tax=Hydra vulgaris TaxID=6087 RepID=UPI001F5E6494|nr:cornifelin homolog A isoform X2 [Hydra vulgaris]XP_047133965.1 cornifelin homolog A isoform X2 [Hydra vulgaris]
MSEFKHGICSCCNDVGLTCVAFFAPAIIVGKNAEHVGDNCCIYGCLGTSCIGVYLRAMTREKIRKKFYIKGTLCKDLCCHLFCCYCALIQEAQLLRTCEPNGEPFELSNMEMNRQ